MKSYLEPVEISRMEKAASNLRDKLLVRLLFRTGCRVSEELALVTEDVDFTHGTITVKHLKARLKLSCPECGQRLGRSHAFCPKCGGEIKEAQAQQQEHRRQRVLPVDKGSLRILKEYIKRGGPVLRDGKRFIFGINRHRAWQICANSPGE
jgi:integrase/recombinase XerD